MIQTQEQFLIGKSSEWTVKSKELEAGLNTVSFNVQAKLEEYGKDVKERNGEIWKQMLMVKEEIKFVKKAIDGESGNGSTTSRSAGHNPYHNADPSRTSNNNTNYTTTSTTTAVATMSSLESQSSHRLDQILQSEFDKNLRENLELKRSFSSIEQRLEVMCQILSQLGKQDKEGRREGSRKSVFNKLEVVVEVESVVAVVWWGRVLKWCLLCAGLAVCEIKGNLLV